MMPTLTTAASDPGRGSARDPLLFLLLAFFLLAYGESTVLASLNRSAGRLLCPTRRAGDENGMRRWSDDDGNVCRNLIFSAARPEPVGHVVRPLWSCRCFAAWRARCAPFGAQVTKTERDG